MFLIKIFSLFLLQIVRFSLVSFLMMICQVPRDRNMEDILISSPIMIYKINTLVNYFKFKTPTATYKV